MKKRIQFSLNLYFTTSKVAAYIILAIGSVYSFLNHDGGVLLATFSAVSAILMLKTYTVGKERISYQEHSGGCDDDFPYKEIEQNENKKKSPDDVG